MIYSKNYRELEISDASERLGAGHLPTIEYMAYNITQMKVKGK